MRLPGMLKAGYNHGHSGSDMREKGGAKSETGRIG